MNLLVFPNQLFASHPGFERDPQRVVLIEDSLFYGDPHHPLKMHQQKLWLHRATMKRFQQQLQEDGFKTEYFDYQPQNNALSEQLEQAARFGRGKSRKLLVAEPVDFLLEKRLVKHCRQLDIELEFLPTPMFLNRPDQNESYRQDKSRWFMADFYKWQRRRLDILMDGDDPVGGQWSFDKENRKKVPPKMLGDLPTIPTTQTHQILEEARAYVKENFGDHPGELENLWYPTNHRIAKSWLDKFLEQRFERFGDYEDAIVEGESWLWHSVLTPALNIGLLTPKQVIEATLKYAYDHDVPLNSVEGFIRQIIGWREFMRATYQDLGVSMRTTNHWNHQRKIPVRFYDGRTGIEPLDDVIRRVLKTGYCHHIERLMVLGGFMFLCEFEPDAIYRWFMEMFVDSYDWVMVPNVYAMSQHADGGQITTKPYFSGSSYIRKMSNYEKGSWCETWDGLYWRWIWKHKDKLSKNPRWTMMCSMAERMDSKKRKQHLDKAKEYLASLND